MNGQRNLKQIFLWPMVLALLTLAGLLSALMANGIWDVLSWSALTVPVGVGLCKAWL